MHHTCDTASSGSRPSPDLLPTMSRPSADHGPTCNRSGSTLPTFSRPSPDHVRSRPRGARGGGRCVPRCGDSGTGGRCIRTHGGASKSGPWQAFRGLQRASDRSAIYIAMSQALCWHALVVRSRMRSTLSDKGEHIDTQLEESVPCWPKECCMKGIGALRHGCVTSYPVAPQGLHHVSRPCFHLIRTTPF